MKQEVIDAFAVLGVDPDVDQATASKAYKKLALQHHPDRNHGDATATQRFQKIGRAWDTISRYYEGDDEGNEAFDSDWSEDDMDDFAYFIFTRMFMGDYSYAKSRRYRRQQHKQHHFYHPQPQYRHYRPTSPDSYDSDDDELYGFDNFTPHSSYNQNQYTPFYRNTGPGNAERQKNEANAEREAYLQRVREFEAEMAVEERRKELNAKEERKALDKTATAYHTAFTAGRAGDGLKMRELIEGHMLDVQAPEKMKQSNNTMKNKKQNVGGQQPNHQTILHVAAAHCDVETVDFLLKKNASTEAINGNRLTPFQLSVLHGNTPVIEYFIQQKQHNKPLPGCHPSKACADGRTILQLAIASQRSDAVAAVVKYATVHDVDRCWHELKLQKDCSLAEELQVILSTKAGFSPSASTSCNSKNNKKMKDAEEKLLAEEKAREEKRKRIEEEQRRAEENRRRKEERKQKREEEERLKKQKEEVSRIDAVKLEQECPKEVLGASPRSQNNLLKSLKSCKISADREIEMELARCLARKEREDEERDRAVDELTSYVRQRLAKEAEERTKIEAAKEAERKAMQEARQREYRLEEERLRREAHERAGEFLRRQSELERAKEHNYVEDILKKLDASENQVFKSKDTTSVQSEEGSVPENKITSQPTRACKYFKHGQCRFGPKCNFLHSPKEAMAFMDAVPLASPGMPIEEIKQISDTERIKRAEQSVRDKARHEQLRKQKLEEEQARSREQLSTPVPNANASSWPTPPMTPEDMQTGVIDDDLFQTSMPRAASVHPSVGAPQPLREGRSSRRGGHRGLRRGGTNGM